MIWYLIDYAMVMFAVIIVPAIIGLEAAKDEPGKLFMAGLLWPIVGAILIVVLFGASIGAGFEQIGKQYSRFVSYMACYWQHQAEKKARKFDEDVAAMKEAMEDERELRKIERQEREDYRHAHCKECGKPLSEV